VEEEGSAVTPLATHRALIFSQSGALLDLVESQVITLGLPSGCLRIAFGLPFD
jgi:hypothetical protein